MLSVYVIQVVLIFLILQAQKVNSVKININFNASDLVISQNFTGTLEIEINLDHFFQVLSNLFSGYDAFLVLLFSAFCFFVNNNYTIWVTHWLTLRREKFLYEYKLQRDLERAQNYQNYLEIPNYSPSREFLKAKLPEMRRCKVVFPFLS